MNSMQHVVVDIFDQVAESHRKARREARKNPGAGKKKMSKDPGIPNLFPYKEDLLRQVHSFVHVLVCFLIARVLQQEMRAKRIEKQNKLQHELRSKAHVILLFDF